MDNLYISASPTTPEVSFQFDQNRLSMRGESYPENASVFYQPIIEATMAYLQKCSDKMIEVNISLGYFNSSSTKYLFNFFDALNKAAADNNHITLNWYYDDEDETILEFGEDLKEDFRSLDYHSYPIETV